MKIACDKCPMQKSCAEKQLACRSYANRGLMGKNPSRKWYLIMTGENIDYAIRRVSAFHKNGMEPSVIASWINENVSQRFIGDLLLPSSIKKDILKYFWREIPVEKLDLMDFVKVKK